MATEEPDFVLLLLFLAAAVDAVDDADVDVDVEDESTLVRLEEGALSCDGRLDDEEDPASFTRCFALWGSATSVALGKCHWVCLLSTWLK
eukprot:CAMPEP_0198250346 /NCGR_PEP_ID=MMETSP1447-20131203/1572_1 /TAXON_ID=420782 /ORGANISM="Chaetoceros dichaeta, Strain CCMP1751" /LENGTH=89 /DNA_ID=CAMNT_0043935161 /DNA_START=458 /DNA_END=727 /DNA_ORIENTATION=-